MQLLQVAGGLEKFSSPYITLVMRIWDGEVKPTGLACMEEMYTYLKCLEVYFAANNVPNEKKYQHFLVQLVGMCIAHCTAY